MRKIFTFLAVLACINLRAQENVPLYRIADSLYVQGIEWYKEQQFEKAFNCFSDCDSINEGRTMPYYSCNASHWKANILYQYGYKKEAINMSPECNLTPVDQRITIYSDSLAFQSNERGKLQEWDSALKLLKKSAEVEAKVLGTSHYYYANSLRSIAKHYQILGQKDSALIYYTMADSAYSKAVGTVASYYQADNLFCCAKLLEERCEIEKALNCYARATNILQNFYGEDNYVVAAVFHPAADLLFQIKDYYNVEIVLKYCLNVWENTDNLASNVISQDLKSLCLCQMQLGDYGSAIVTCQTAIETNKQSKEFSVEFEQEMQEIGYQIRNASNQFQEKIPIINRTIEDAYQLYKDSLYHDALSKIDNINGSELYFNDDTLAIYYYYTKGKIINHIGMYEDGISCLDTAMTLIEREEYVPDFYFTVMCEICNSCLRIEDYTRLAQYVRRTIVHGDYHLEKNPYCPYFYEDLGMAMFAKKDKYYVDILLRGQKYAQSLFSCKDIDYYFPLLHLIDLLEADNELEQAKSMFHRLEQLFNESEIKNEKVREQITSIRNRLFNHQPYEN